MKDAMENNDLFMRIITDVYEEHTIKLVNLIK